MKFILSETQYRSILIEGRKERLAKKYDGSLSNAIIDDVLNDPFNEQTNHKYSDFILKSYRNSDGLNYKDIINTVKYFDEKQKAFDKKDINTYQDYEELKSVVDAHRKKSEDEKSVVKIFESDTYLIIKPQTHKASCKYGAGTKWCTAMKDYPSHFESRNTDFKSLYYVMTKPLTKENSLYKIAIYIDNGKESWYDAEDKLIDSNLINSLKNVYLKDGYGAVRKDYDDIYSTDIVKLKNRLDNLFKKYVKNGFYREVSDGISGPFTIEFTNMDIPDPEMPGWYHSSILFKFLDGEVIEIGMAAIEYDILNNGGVLGVELNVTTFESGQEFIVNLQLDDNTFSATHRGGTIRDNIFDRLFNVIIEKIHRWIPDKKREEIGNSNPNNPNMGVIKLLVNGIKNIQNDKFTFPGVLTGDVNAIFLLEIPGLDIANLSEIEDGLANEIKIITELTISKKGRIGSVPVEGYTLYIIMKPHMLYGNIKINTEIYFEVDVSNFEGSFNLNGKKINTQITMTPGHSESGTITKREIGMIMSKIAGLIIDQEHMISILNPNRDEGDIVWSPNKAYSYTFTKKEGTMIGKLVDLLDSGWEGTRYDFLSYLWSGSREPNQYSQPFRRSMRGQYSHFFAQARQSGVIKLEKRGRKAYIVKGPNFNAFKEGRLKPQ